MFEKAANKKQVFHFTCHAQKCSKQLPMVSYYLSSWKYVSKVLLNRNYFSIENSLFLRRSSRRKQVGITHIRPRIFRIFSNQLCWPGVPAVAHKQRVVTNVVSTARRCEGQSTMLFFFIKKKKAQSSSFQNRFSLDFAEPYFVFFSHTKKKDTKPVIYSLVFRDLWKEQNVKRLLF